MEVGFIYLLEIQLHGTAFLCCKPKGGCSMPLSLDMSGVVNKAELHSLLSLDCLEVALHSYTLPWINI